MADSIEELLKREQRSLQGHSRKYRIYFIGQILVLCAVSVSAAINAFAQTEAANGSPYANPDLLFWSGIISAVATVIVGLGLTAEVSKQRARRDFHRMMVGKLERGSIGLQEANGIIEEYFQNWRN